MRENTKWIMLVTALAFVALMVFEWGMDMSGRSGGGVGEIGRVNGTAIMYEDYITTVRNLSDQIQAQTDEPLTSEQQAQLEDRAFDEMVARVLIEQELERRGVRVTEEEIRNAAQFSPPPEFRSAPIFQTDGRFDIQKYQQYISSPQVDEQTLLYLEDYYRRQIPQAKLLRQVSSGLYLTDQELWRRYRDRNETATVRYVALDPVSRIPDTEVEVTDAEIEAYYDEHRDDFQVPAQASVRAVVLSKVATAADTAAALERARDVARQLRGDATWDEVAALESADEGTAAQGGDLGVFAGPGAEGANLPRMVPAFEEAVFEGAVGEVQDPVLTQYGYHVIEVTERWGQDSARARHVLIPTDRTDASEIALFSRVDSLEELTEDLSLADAAQRLGLEVRDVQLTEEFPIVQGVGRAGEGTDWALEEAQPGDVSPIFENQQAFYQLELVERSPAGPLPLEDASRTIRQVLLLDAKMERARQQGQQIVQRARGGQSLEQAAQSAGFDVNGAGPFTRLDFVPGLGRQNAAIGAAFGLDEGEVSDVVRAGQNAFVVQLVERTPADSAAWLEQLPQQREQLQQEMQQQRLTAWLEGLREQARIVDRRADVLSAPDEEQPLRPQGGLGF